MIRRITSIDVDETLRVFRESCPESHPFLARSFIRKCEKLMRERTLLELETDVFVDGTIRGFISRGPSFIDALFVAPSFQCRGVGKQLLDHVKAQSSVLVLSVFAQNSRAVRFYQREGFWATAVKPHPKTGETIVALKWEAKNDG